MSDTRQDAAAPGRDRSSIWIQFESDDIDELHEAVRDWDFVCIPLDRGGFRGGFSLVANPARGVQFLLGGYPCNLKQVGAPPRGLRTFAIPSSPELRIGWRGKLVSGNDIMLFPLNGELEAYTQHAFLVFIVAVPQERLERMVEALQLHPQPTRFLDRELYPCDPAHMRRLQAALHRHMEALIASPELRRDYDVPTDLLARVLQTLATSWVRTTKGDTSQRVRAALAAERIILREAMRAPRISDVAQRVGVTVRTLQLGFRKMFGTTPKAYLHSVRLHHARCALRDALPDEAKVSDIANAWGFWHMGQFAADYWRMFGEKPSETLARNG